MGAARRSGSMLRRRRLFRLLLLLAGGALLALLALPWWFGPLLRGTAAHGGLSFATYERVGYARFALRKVVYQRAGVRVTAERVEADTPLLWLWRHATGSSRVVAATRWKVEVKASENPSPTSPDQGGMKLRGTLLNLADQLDRWLPRADLGPGEVTWKGGGLKVASVNWQQRTLAIRSLTMGGQLGDVTAAFPADHSITLEAVTPGAPWQVKFKSQDDDLTGEFRLWDQVATLQARFGPAGWLPATAEVRAPNWSVPGTRLQLEKFYSTISADARLEWKDGKFDTAIQAKGEAIPGQAALPLDVDLRGHGDTELLTVDALSVNLPGITATLSAPVQLDRQGVLRSGASVLAVAVDLAQQPWFVARGRVSGTARLTPRENAPPRVVLTLEGHGLGFRDWNDLDGRAEATLDWPDLQVSTATFALGADNRVSLHGGWNFQTGELTAAAADGAFARTAVSRWLPDTVDFATATFSVTAHGTPAALQHEGTARVTGLALPGLHPLAVEAAWQGKGTAVDLTEVTLRAGASELRASGTFDPNGAQVRTLRFSQAGSERLALAQPAAMRWSPALEIGPLQLAGPESSLGFTLVMGTRGQVELAAQNIPSGWWTDMVALAVTEWRIASLTAQGQWDNGPMTFSTAGELALALAPNRFAMVRLALRGDKDGLTLDTLQAAEGAAPILTASGRGALTLAPGKTDALVTFDEQAPLELHAATATNPAFWKSLLETTGLELQEPVITADLSGSWAQPRGEIKARVARVSADPQRIKGTFPVIENLEAHALGNRDGVTVDQLAVKVDGQAVRANGQLPLSVTRWKEFQADPLTFARKEGSFQLEIPDAELAAVARYVPAVLSPAGRLQLALTVKPGGDMQGSGRLTDAVSRPFGSLGIFQDIQGMMKIEGQTVTLQSLTAQSGGQPVTLSGKVQLPLDAPPIYDLTLRGKNLPLVRQTGLLLRTDLDLGFVTQKDGVPAITGSVTLRDSVFLSDVRSLIPSPGSGGPARRPPFFAVETPPFDRWRLNVTVTGDSFLRLRSPVFDGVASARFRLLGTLGDPRAIGEAVVETGRIHLPFAAFEVEQGTVRLTEANPYDLGLFISGTARRYGYDLRMEITGTATQPVVTFSSSPPLDAKQVLLLVMAGEMPRDETIYGNNQRVARLGAYLGQGLISRFGSETTDAERLSISTGDRISEQGRETYNVEYQLNDRFSLVTEYDEFDTFNAGVKWNILGRKKAATSRSALPPMEKSPEAP